MIESLTIDGRDIELFIVKKNETDYIRLGKCLLAYLTDNQLNKLIYVKGNKNIILFSDLIEQYEFKGFLRRDNGKCICGVNICSQYLIKNIDSNEEFVIGSVCKDNWSQRDCISYYCQFCNKKKTNGENCLNCQGKKTLKTIFLTMKKIMEDKVDFGMYKNKMSYYKLTYTKPSYCNWLVNESNISSYKKDKIRFLMNNE